MSRPSSHCPSPASQRSSRSARASVEARSLIALLAAATSVWGCSAHADIPKVVVERSDVGFDGVPRVPGVELTATVINSFDHPKGYKLPSLFDSKLYPIGASITGRGAMTDLSFIEGVTLTLSSRAEDAPPPVVVARYERDAGDVGRAIHLETDSDTDVLGYWTTKSAYYDVELWGTLPEENWSVDISATFSGEISVFASE